MTSTDRYLRSRKKDGAVITSTLKFVFVKIQYHR